MDDQGNELPKVGGTNSSSSWRSETLHDEPKPKQSLLQRLRSIFRRNNTVEVSSDGGPKKAMTAEEADAQAKAKLEEAKAKAPPGAEVKLEDRGGGTREVVTRIPDEQTE